MCMSVDKLLETQLKLITCGIGVAVVVIQLFLYIIGSFEESFVIEEIVL